MAPTTNASPRVFRPKFVSRMVGVGYLLMLASGFDLFWLHGVSSCSRVPQGLRP